MVLGADLIAGFPTETEEMFANTIDLVEACGLTYLHVFPYSARKGTPAARMPQVARDIVKQRAARLREQGKAALASYLTSQVAQETQVLMERGDIGRTPQFAEVEVAGSAADTHLLQVRIEGSTGERLVGRVIGSGERT
jgi:threonylcarbamoyladenosine tRNA methylthiotransferase MtaB